jgi:hypothetical protein
MSTGQFVMHFYYVSNDIDGSRPDVQRKVYEIVADSLHRGQKVAEFLVELDGIKHYGIHSPSGKEKGVYDVVVSTRDDIDEILKPHEYDTPLGPVRGDVKRRNIENASLEDILKMISWYLRTRNVAWSFNPDLSPAQRREADKLLREAGMMQIPAPTKRQSNHRISRRSRAARSCLLDVRTATR